MSRLRKNHTRTKTASYYMLLDSIVLKSGDLISFEAKILSNRPWFQITHESQFNSSSYYDGPDFERAYYLYEELLIAFKGAARAEKLKKSKTEIENKIDNLVKEKKLNKNDDMYNALKRKPLFLGIDDF